MIAFIRKKTRVEFDYFGLTLRHNNIELLATSSFFGELTSQNVSAFLGSSIGNLPVSITESYHTASTDWIFILRTPARSVNTERLINQYIKKQAGKKWMLISQKFQQKRFSPAHPLYFHHKRAIPTAASLLLRVFAHGTLL